MRGKHLRNCVRVLALEYSRYRTDAKGVAAALGLGRRGVRSVFRYRDEIRRARALLADSGGSLADGKGNPRAEKPIVKRSRLPARSARRVPDPSELDGEARSRSHKNLLHLARCDEILRLEFSGERTTVEALAERFRLSRRMVFHDLALVEEALGRPLTLVARRNKTTKP